MAEGLRLKSTSEKTISDKFDELSARMLQMQEQIKFIGSKQAKEIQQDLSLPATALEPKSDNTFESHVTNPLFVRPNYEQRHLIFHNLYKLEVPRFDGTEPLGWIFKDNQFYNSSYPR